jgi:hypothetical protein
MLTQTDIEDLCDRLLRQDALVGILLVGSYASGKAHQHSDLDLRLVNLRGIHLSDESTTWNGVRLQLIHETPEAVRYWCEQGRVSGWESTVHCWAHGIILYDPAGIVAELQVTAQQIWESGPMQGPWRTGGHRLSVRLQKAVHRMLHIVGLWLGWHRSV